MQDIAASYLVGALGGIVYLRLLGRGVDSVAPTSFGEAAGSALGQQRLLIPVILVLFYNRYDQQPTCQGRLDPTSMGECIRYMALELVAT